VPAAGSLWSGFLTAASSAASIHRAFRSFDSPSTPNPMLAAASLRRVIARLPARTSRPPASCPRRALPIMFSPTRPITIDAASRRRQPSYPDYDYGIHAEAVPPVDSGDMMFDLDGTYDYALANPHAWPAHTAPAAFDLSSPVADYMSPTKDNSFFDPSALLGHDLSGAMDDDYSWALATGVSTSAPIAIPEPKFAPSQQQQPSFMSYNDFSSPLFQDAHAFSPGFSPSSFSPESDFAALHSPTSPPAFTFHNELPQQYGTPIEALSALTISPQETTLPYGTSAPAPAWAAHLWPAQHEQPQVDAYQPRSYVPEDIMPRRARALSQSLLFHPSTSAPSAATIRPPALARGYSTQSDSVGADASTVRRRSRSHSTSSEAFAEPGTPEARATSPLKDASITADKAAESGKSRHNLTFSEALLWLTLRFHRVLQERTTPAQAGSVGMAALLHRLDSEAPADFDQEAQRCSGGEGGRCRVRCAHHGGEGGQLPVWLTPSHEHVADVVRSRTSASRSRRRTPASASITLTCAR
jgi:hypothetical protein